jgi:hypothetical protein
MMGYYPGTTTSVPAGNGNGFKLGGYGGVYVANAPQHTARLNVAFKNKAYGFYANHHPVANYFYNNTGVANHADFNMLGIDPSGAAISLGILRNNLAWQGTLVMNMAGADVANNSWNLASVSVTSADFQSTSLDGWDAPRLPDGSLPALPYLHLASGSDLLDKGVDVGLPYTGAAPDLGAFEGSTPVTLFTDAGPNMKVTQSGLTLNRTTQQMSGTLSFTNQSTTTYDGVLMARLDLLSDGVTLANRSGSQGGAPTLTVTSAHLAPGQTVTFPLVFTNPAHVAIGYTPRLFASQP